MKQIEVFHCSPTRIEEFDFTLGPGVHFGGIFSSLEAGIRKAYDNYGNIASILYIHKCILTLPQQVVEVKDQGGEEGWLDLIENDSTLSPAYKYTNEFEPDVVPSWLVLEPHYISLFDVVELKVDEASDILGEFYSGNIHSISL